MGLFKRGYEVSRQEKERQDKARELGGKKLWRLFLKDDGDEADLRFLTEEPINFYEHTLKSKVNGKDRYDSVTCIGNGCKHCADGDRPTYKGAYLVVDRREFEYTDKDGNKKTGKNQLRLFVQGMKIITQLDRISNKYGLSNRDVTMVRLGKGTNTTYTFERGDTDKLTQQEIEELLGDRFKEDYDGTVDSLYTIVENQLLMDLKENTDEEVDEDDEEDEDNAGVIGFDDDEEDEEVEEAPKKKLGTKKKSMFKSGAQHSLKPKSGAKTLLKKRKAV